MAFSPFLPLALLATAMHGLFLHPHVHYACMTRIVCDGNLIHDQTDEEWAYKDFWCIFNLHLVRVLSHLGGVDVELSHFELGSPLKPRCLSVLWRMPWNEMKCSCV